MKSRFRDMNDRLLSRYGGTVVLSRNVPGEPPINPWDPPNPPAIVTETLPFVHTKAAVELLAANTVLDSDLLGVLHVPTGTLLEPKITDTVAHDGKNYVIMNVQAVSADGDTIHFAIQARK